MAEAELKELLAKRAELVGLIDKAAVGFDFDDFDEHGRPVEVTRERVAMWRERLQSVDARIAQIRE